MVRSEKRAPPPCEAGRQSRSMDLSRLDRSLIAGLPPFQGMSPDELDRMVGQARSLRIAKDQPVFEQEQDAHSFFLLLDGHVRVVKATPDGQYGEYTVTSSGSPLSVNAPKEAGDAEVRYMSGQGGKVLARIPIRIVP